jgi:hypothetical protein
VTTYRSVNSLFESLAVQSRKHSLNRCGASAV